jgi:hypothetical protein
MASSREMAVLAFGDPGFFDFIARGFKSVAPALSFAAGFVPGVGPLLSKAVDAAAGLVADEPVAAPGHTDDDADDGGTD